MPNNTKISFKMGNYSNLPSTGIEPGALYLAKDDVNGSLYYGESATNLIPIISITTPYATCTTPGDTQIKVISCPSFQLIHGAKIIITFQNSNSVASPKLNINSTGAKDIYYAGLVISKSYLKARTYEFVYNNENDDENGRFEFVGDVNTNTTYKAATDTTKGLVLSGGDISVSSTGKVTVNLPIQKLNTTTENIITIANSMPDLTRKVYYCGSGALSCGCPENHCVVYIDRGSSNRCVMNCYAISSKRHYINSSVDVIDKPLKSENWKDLTKVSFPYGPDLPENPKVGDFFFKI